MKYKKGNRDKPTLRWKFDLPSYPKHAPESTPVFDKYFNIYFGAHDFCIYSLNSEGQLRWMFKTGEKVYSSPTILDENKVCIASGDGNFFCFGLDGNLLWVYNISNYKIDKKPFYIRNLQKLLSSTQNYSHAKKSNMKVKCWSSPNINSDGIVYITGFGLGLHAIDATNGKKMWGFDLGCPRNHLSGVAINENDEIFVASQQRNLYCLKKGGSVKWHTDSKLNYDAWGNPSIDYENKTVYFPLSFKEEKSEIQAFDYEGNLKWKRSIDGAIRGSVAISYKEYVLVCSFNGKMYFLDKENGVVLESIQLSNTQRALWTTPAIDKDGNIFVTTKDSPYTGSLYCISENARIIWRYKTGKTLSTPVIDQFGRVYIGTWNGEFLCLET